jgi:DNA polymerase-3 subunit delta
VTPAELEVELAEGRVRPAYLLAGPEPLLRDDAREALLSTVLGDADRNFNFDRLEGGSATAGGLEDAVRALPVFAARRLVLLREPEGGRRRADALLEALARVVAELPDPPETVLVVSAAKADKRARWVKAFSEPAARIDCEAPRGRALPAFVRSEAKRQGVSLGRGAAEALAERVGPQLLLLRRELEKAALVAGPGSKVEAAHVAEVVGVSVEEPVWDLTDAIGTGRVGDALAVLGRLEAGGAPAPVLLGALASHFRKLARVRAGGKVGGHPFAVRKLEEQAGRYSLPGLRACLRSIHDTDEILKGRGDLPADLALERLVLHLAG